jgi:hypothetical protein
VIEVPEEKEVIAVTAEIAENDAIGETKRRRAIR